MSALNNLSQLLRFSYSLLRKLAQLSGNVLFLFEMLRNQQLCGAESICKVSDGDLYVLTHSVTISAPTQPELSV